jgi:integrase
MPRSTPGIQVRKNSDGTTSYRVQVRLRGHEHRTATFAKLTDAKDWRDKMRVAIKSGTAPSTEAEITTLDKALERYAREVTPTKKDSARELNRIKVWRAHPLAKRYLTRVRGADLAAFRDKRREEGVAENTIRLDLALISHLYTIAAKDWGMEGLRNPVKSMTLPGGSNERDRRLEEGEEEKLLAALAVEGPYMAEAAAFAIATAMRQGEILGLSWAAVDLQRGIAHLVDTKNGEARDVPLSPAAIEILKALPRSLDDATPVFPVTQHDLIRAFRRACDAAGLVDLKFHDLRHEAVSRLFERGLNVAEVAAISGHKTWSQLKRYTQLKAEDLARKLA